MDRSIHSADTACQGHVMLMGLAMCIARYEPWKATRWRMNIKRKSKHFNLPVLLDIDGAVVVVYCRLGAEALVRGRVKGRGAHLRVALRGRILFLDRLSVLEAGRNYAGLIGRVVLGGRLRRVLGGRCSRRGCSCRLCGLLVVAVGLSAGETWEQQGAMLTDRRRYPRQRRRQP